MNMNWINAADFGASGSVLFCTGKNEAGANRIIVTDPADFREGQWITASNCFYHTYGTVYNEKEPYYARNQKPLADEIEIEGLTEGKREQVFILHFLGENCYSWMVIDPVYQSGLTTLPIIRKNWLWQGVNLKLHSGWHELCDGVRIRFRKTDWKKGESISFHVRRDLYAQILKIEGHELVLDRNSNCGGNMVTVQHHDNAVLQQALNAAVLQHRMLYIPAGTYRLSDGLWLRHADVHVEGEDREHTILDVSDAHTACFWIGGGNEIVIRKMSMVGHTGYMELPATANWTTANGFEMWPTANQQMEIRGCSAINAVSTKHMLFEDLNISRMAGEAIYLHGSSRYGTQPYIQKPHEDIEGLDKQHQKTCIIHRCNGYDCGFNLFNNNDFAEDTIISECRAERVGNFCENASEYSRYLNNHILDGCMLTVCGKGNSVISGNIFEGGASGGVISLAAGNVLFTNNIVRQFSKETPIWISGKGPIQVKNNIIELTVAEGNPDHIREGINVNGSRVQISGNQIIGGGSMHTCGVIVDRKAENVMIQDNMIENCDSGLYFGFRNWDREAQQWNFTKIQKADSIHVQNNLFLNCRREETRKQ